MVRVDSVGEFCNRLFDRPGDKAVTNMEEQKKRRGRPKQEPAQAPEKYPRVSLVKSKLKQVLDPIKYDMIQHKEYMYLISNNDGQCLLCPGPSPASYLAVTVPEDCIKPYRPKRGSDSR